jgi:hypothetical protein
VENGGSAQPKWKRNGLFKAVQAAGLSPEAFHFDDSADEVVIRHASSGATFTFSGAAGKYVSSYVAGDATGPELTKNTWEGLIKRVGLWLSDVKQDVETPDLWAELGRQRELVVSASDQTLENTPFTPNEREEISEQLNEFRADVKAAFALSQQQAEELDERVNYLIDATKRLGRKDWLNNCIGSMFGYVLTVAFPPDASRHLLNMLAISIGHFFGHGLPGIGGG